MPNIFNKGTNKQGLIVYSGGASANYGIVVGEAPSFEKPTKRMQIFNIPGRNGSVVLDEGSYNDTTRTYNVWLSDNEELDLTSTVYNVCEWLFSPSGYQRLEDSFEPDIFRLAYYSGGNEISNELTMYGRTALKFTCRPERFYKEGEIEIPVTNGQIVFNKTSYISKPLIHIEGSGSVSVSIGGVTINATITDYINLDCERLNAYRLPSENKNNQVTGTFPTLKPGNNTVTTTGSITKMTIIPRYYTI